MYYQVDAYVSTVRFVKNVGGLVIVWAIKPLIHYVNWEILKIELSP